LVCIFIFGFNNKYSSPSLGAAEDQNSKILVRVFVVLLRVYSQWGLERTKPTPAGSKTARMVSS